MAHRGHKLIAAIAIASLSSLATDAGAAWAGNAHAHNPNMRNFYMARQQVQIIDNSPIIQYSGNAGAPPGAAQRPKGPVPLPRAGFQRFSNQLPTYSNTLPAVNNGVPRAPIPQKRGPTGKRGKAGKLKKSKKKTAKKKMAKPTTRTAKSYSPYKGYDPSTASKKTAKSNAGVRSKSRVKGSVLHWARGRGK